MVTQGFSKDHRPDLTQIVHELLVSKDGRIPLMCKTWSGNAADNKIFTERAKTLIDYFGKMDGTNYLIADSKLYTKNNAENLQKINFITRIPNSISKVNLIIETALSKSKWQKLTEQDRYFVHELTHYPPVSGNLSPRS